MTSVGKLSCNTILVDPKIWCLFVRDYHIYLVQTRSNIVFGVRKQILLADYGDDLRGNARVPLHSPPQKPSPLYSFP